jgi:hypothetical protein
MDMENVVQVWVYLEDINAYSEMNKVYAEFFPFNPRPVQPRTTVPGESEMEMAVIAWVRERSSGQAGLLPGLRGNNTVHLAKESVRRTLHRFEQVRQAIKM